MFVCVDITCPQSPISATLCKAHECLYPPIMGRSRSPSPPPPAAKPPKAPRSPSSPKAPKPPKAPVPPKAPKPPKVPKVPKAPNLSPPPPPVGNNNQLVQSFPFFTSCNARDVSVTPYRMSVPSGPWNTTASSATYCFRVAATATVNSASPCAGMTINRMEMIIESGCVDEEPKPVRTATINGVSVVPLLSSKTWKGETYGVMTLRRLADIFPTTPSGGLYICLELARTSRCSTPAGMCYGNSCVFALSNDDFTCCPRLLGPLVSPYGPPPSRWLRPRRWLGPGRCQRYGTNTPSRAAAAAAAASRSAASIACFRRAAARNGVLGKAMTRTTMVAAATKVTTAVAGTAAEPAVMRSYGGIVITACRTYAPAHDYHFQRHYYHYWPCPQRLLPLQAPARWRAISKGRCRTGGGAAFIERKGPLRVVAFREGNQQQQHQQQRPGKERMGQVLLGMEAGAVAAADPEATCRPFIAAVRSRICIAISYLQRNLGITHPYPSPRVSTVALVLGGGESDRRLFPLTEKRALPAVPVGGSYRLIDIPLSNCLHSNINKIYVLTQYNITNYNGRRYITRTYGFGDGVPLGGDGFVEVLATTQYPGGSRWPEGNADAVRLMSWVLENPQLRHVKHVLILPADQLYRANFEDLITYHQQRVGAGGCTYA
ncbi:hypothetical protein VOLCADRAFT_91226 [Volvox carteri f. nagariensis]|uniref:glucose-1-phosphate adenylyltransferase n=1 Tax=Volvox carteri f. nagariensis TaxID=3068 RepID=D8TWI3_VOLCA|nr:uncharacterized protein VOLCADRAFT_91226 [Volvox carteri f. nagariensis]EFJ48159.1 hypothetical protein VOLCADRAFT_91226 [Volvox carteri f. nagariensis]|eukprot:XP_002950844.1 hypothetical protein VOLCADRAFT_91226 [Volvox carteri f. nagariensis]